MHFISELFKEVYVQIDKSMLYGVAIGLVLSYVPWRLWGKQFHALLDRVFGEKTSDALQKKIKAVLEDFIKGMEEGTSVEVNVNVKNDIVKASAICSTFAASDKIKSPSLDNQVFTIKITKKDNKVVIG